MDTNKMREQFEAWARTCSNPLIDGDFRWMESRNTYYWSVTRGMWEAWQASREAVVVSVPAFDEYPASMERDMQQSLRAAIEAQGLKVAP